MVVLPNIKTASILLTCHHLTDFSIDCMWNVFATSPGKSLSDEIGGVVKGLTARASLQCALSSQILSGKTMF